jgi:hypothetical protein
VTSFTFKEKERRKVPDTFLSDRLENVAFRRSDSHLGLFYYSNSLFIVTEARAKKIPVAITKARISIGRVS